MTFCAGCTLFFQAQGKNNIHGDRLEQLRFSGIPEKLNVLSIPPPCLYFRCENITEI